MSELVPIQPQYSTDQISLIKDTICRGSSDDELKMFMEICKRTRLDPFSKQIYAVKRWDSNLNREVMSAQTSIDGLRILAERTGKYKGQVGPLWCGKDGKWMDVWLSEEAPSACKVGVLRSDFSEVLWGIAKFTSYAQTKKDGSLTQFWKKMPDLMIAKVAEALALKKAFPNDLYLPAGEETVHEIKQRHFEEVLPPAVEKLIEKQIEQVTKKEIKNYAPQAETIYEPANVDIIKEDKIDQESFLITFGKHTGKTINQLGIDESKNYAAWLKKTAEGSGKPITDRVKMFIDLVEKIP